MSRAGDIAATRACCRRAARRAAGRSRAARSSPTARRVTSRRRTRARSAPTGDRRRRRGLEPDLPARAAGTGRTTAAALGDARRPDRTARRRVLTALFDGPNAAESGDDLNSAIPTDLEFDRRPAQPAGLGSIDVNDGLDQLDAVDLRMRLAQIVATATAVDGVDEVQIRVNGEERQWPKGDGALTDQAADALRLSRHGRVDATALSLAVVADSLSLARPAMRTTVSAKNGSATSSNSCTSTGRVLPTAVAAVLAFDAIAAQHRHLPPRPVVDRLDRADAVTGSTAPGRTPSAYRRAGRGRVARPGCRSPSARRSPRRCGWPRRRAARDRTGRTTSTPSRACRASVRRPRRRRRSRRSGRVRDDG